MKRVLKKALAFLSAVAVAASMAVSASAASAGKRIVKNGGYKQVVSTNDGIFFANFTEKDLKNSAKSKTILCVTPDGKTKKVKIDNMDYGSSSGMNTGSVYSDRLAPGYLTYNFHDKNYSSNGHIEQELIFSTGKTLTVSNVSIDEQLHEINYGEYVVVNDNILPGVNRYSDYSQSNYTLYDSKGKKLITVPYSALKGADGDGASLEDYDSKTKSCLFVGSYDPDTGKNPIWLVRDNKTVAQFSAINYDVSFVQDKKGNTIVKTYTDYDTFNREYYSLETGKKLSKVEEGKNNDAFSISSKYSVSLVGKKYSVFKSGKKLYSIENKKVAGYHIYENSVAIITKSGSKYGLIMVS